MCLLLLRQCRLLYDKWSVFYFLNTVTTYLIVRLSISLPYWNEYERSRSSLKFVSQGVDRACLYVCTRKHTWRINSHTIQEDGLLDYQWSRVELLKFLWFFSLIKREYELRHVTHRKTRKNWWQRKQNEKETKYRWRENKMRATRWSVRILRSIRKI